VLDVEHHPVGKADARMPSAASVLSATTVPGVPKSV
jgi:hypothetical protein